MNKEALKKEQAEKLKQTKESFAKFKTKLESKAASDQDAVAELSEIVSSLANTIYAVQEETYANYWKAMDYVDMCNMDHKKGHLPPINSGGKMDKILAMLELDKEFAYVKPSYVLASDKGSVTVTLERFGK